MPTTVARKKILIVDDSPTAILWQRLILEADPYDIVVANDGEEGVQVARDEMPDLILLDVVMPRMSGFEALRALRAEESLRNVPILMVTTRGEMQNVLEGYESGCNEYITKPVDRAELLTKVRSYLHTGVGAS
jgi:two-component system alkaline phosphatase synthesis response regulator PhoP